MSKPKKFFLLVNVLDPYLGCLFTKNISPKCYTFCSVDKY